jgi:predicted nuclease of predicted toxin-antitoxin system
MKLLIDENLSDKLVTRLSDHYPGSQHVKQLQLQATPDLDIWDLAKAQGFTILTQDDFVGLSALNGTPPKVIHLAMGNHTTAQWLSIIFAHQENIALFDADERTGLLVIR